MTTTTRKFTSLEAHNGCRALFNHTKGWAYIGPAGEIDPDAQPGIISYKFGPASHAFRRHGDGMGNLPTIAPPTAAPARAGDNVGRKTNEVLSAYLDGEDLEHFMEIEHTGRFVGGGAAAVRGELGGVDGAGGNACSGPRGGLPIVLTLQAILAGTSHSAGEENAGVGIAGHEVATPASVQTGMDVESGDAGGPPRVSDHAHFPPLRSPELFLAPPIMVKPDVGAAGSRGISCSEAVAASSVAAEAAATAAASAAANGGNGNKTGGGGVSRVGWWLRWAIAGSGSVADAVAGDADTTSVNQDVNATRPGATGTCPGGGVAYEMRGGLDGWQVVSVDNRGKRAIPNPCLLSDGVVATAAAAAAVEDDEDGASSWCDVDVADMTTVGTGSGSCTPMQNISRNVPQRSFRDMLMTPNSAGEMTFAAGPGKGGPTALYPTATTPRLMGDTGTYLWRNAATGKGGGKVEGDEGLEDEDPYYARKRVGAFAFRTKPRGKAHK